MRAKMTARLCQVSFVAGALLTPPTMRKAKQQTAKVARRGARSYVNLRTRAQRVGEATGKPGQYTVIAAAFAAQAAKDVADKWREMVAEAEREAAAENSDKFGLYLPPEPVTTIKNYVGNSV